MTVDPRPGDVEVLSQRERARRSCHDAVDAVCDAWPAARDDAAAIGWRASVRPGAGGSGDVADPTATFAAALVEHPDVAVAWIAELHDVMASWLDDEPAARGFGFGPGWWIGYGAWVIRRVWHAGVDVCAGSWPKGEGRRRRLYALADSAARHWPGPPAKGSTDGTVTVGERGNSVAVCKLCGDPAAGGAADPLKRLDGDAYHLLASGGRQACFWVVWRQRGGASRKRSA